MDMQQQTASPLENPAIVVSPFGNKRAVATLLCLSVRTVDNLMARGLPHMKIGSRRVRFDLTQVSEWAKREFSVRRLGAGHSPRGTK
jgi:predicted DNA-binding transcriptional regulator AlpA